MRILFIIIFFFLAAHTEGVSQNDIPVSLDTSYLENIPQGDSDVNIQENAPKVPQKGAYEEATKQYYKENIQQKEFDKNDWQKATSGLDYTIEKEEQKKKQEANNKKKNTVSPLLNSGLVFFFKWFFIIAAVGILAFLILKFVGEGNIFGRQSRRVFAPSVQIDLERIEENLNNVELDPLIKQAIAQKQFALAIRLYYLATIKELNISGAIQWKKDKTNREYTREMRPHRLSEPFRETTSIFERVWYGDALVDEATFMLIQPAFQDLLKQTRKG